MADFAVDTAVEGENGRYHARLSSDWEIWGPQGGYVATIALRAAGAESEFERPASFYCHYLNVAGFEDVDIEVVTLRRSRRAESLRVSMTQESKPILEALVWNVDQLEGVDHDYSSAPEVPKPNEVKSWAEHFPEGEPPFTFWHHVEGRPVGWDPSMAGEPRPPFSLLWYRLVSSPVSEDQFVEAGRALTFLDVSLYPAALNVHGGNQPYVAPSMDFAISFHGPTDGSEFLLVEARSPVAAEGLVGGTGSVWSESGRLVATGIQQMLQRVLT